MPLINQDIGLVKMARLYGLKRRFFGLESKRSLAKRVVNKLREQSPLTQLFDGLSKAFEPRVCVREEYQEIETPPYYIDNGVAIELPGPMQLLKVWTFHYSDGTTEQLVQTGAL